MQSDGRLLPNIDIAETAAQVSQLARNVRSVPRLTMARFCKVSPLNVNG